MEPFRMNESAEDGLEWEKRDVFIDTNMGRLFPKEVTIDSNEVIMESNTQMDEWFTEISMKLYIEPEMIETPVVEHEVVIQSKPIKPNGKKRGRPPIKDPIEKASRRHQREKEASKRWRAKDKISRLEAERALIKEEDKRKANLDYIQQLAQITHQFKFIMADNPLKQSTNERIRDRFNRISECLESIEGIPQ